MKWNIPNILTSFRILLIPVFLIVFYLPFEDARFWSAFIFWLAAITDALDGWIARFNLQGYLLEVHLIVLPQIA